MSEDVDSVGRGIGLTGPEQVTAVLTAELGLLDLLIDQADTFAKAQQEPAKAWLKAYWIRQLTTHREATDEWLKGIGQPDNPTLAAARAEFDALCGLRSTTRLYRETFNGLNAAARAAFRSWLDDFKVEIEAKQDIINALD